MMHRTPISQRPLPGTRALSRGGSACWRIRLVRVPSGVAAGRNQRVKGNAHDECWTLYSTREQFDACAMVDPLRFTDPLLFAQIKREFDDAIDRPDAGALHP